MVCAYVWKCLDRCLSPVDPFLSVIIAFAICEHRMKNECVLRCTEPYATHKYNQFFYIVCEKKFFFVQIIWHTTVQCFFSALWSCWKHKRNRDTCDDNNNASFYVQMKKMQFMFVFNENKCTHFSYLSHCHEIKTSEKKNGGSNNNSCSNSNDFIFIIPDFVLVLFQLLTTI